PLLRRHRLAGRRDLGHLARRHLVHHYGHPWHVQRLRPGTLERQKVSFLAGTVLAARNVCKSYGSGETRFHALRGMSLDIGYGQSVAIVGKSGSGKSTLMHLLALLDTPDSGSVSVDGVDAQGRTPRDLNIL